MRRWPWLRACLSVLDGMKQRGLHFDPQMAQVYEQLAGLFGQGSSATAARPIPPPPKEASLEEVRETAARYVRKSLWEVAAMEFQKLITMGEPLPEVASNLVGCLLNAHAVPLESDVSRIQAIIEELEQAGHAAVAAPLREQLAAQVAAAHPKKQPWWKVW